MEEAVRVIIRFIHLLAGTTWVGGSIFYWAVLSRQSRAEGASPTQSFLHGVSQTFGEVTQLCMGGLMVTGAIMTIDRLTSPTVSLYYVLVLGVKVIAAGGMFFIAWTMRQRRRAASLVRNPGPVNPVGFNPLVQGDGKLSERISLSTVILALGVVVFALGALLTRTYEIGIEGAYRDLLEIRPTP